ncbi:hypothetical protein [Sorangium atrum]|uniref:Uncharacterized protein n=1 Tax=Sorangium atrum TaxID=2995308 RepID=A0ABT5C756_9BACT|nr:hypothetical protein [Sorangium aterium]MDC0682246.1 hypothetical protein [Sorangium aterium]
MKMLKHARRRARARKKTAVLSRNVTPWRRPVRLVCSAACRYLEFMIVNRAPFAPASRNVAEPWSTSSLVSSGVRFAQKFSVWTLLLRHVAKHSVCQR